MKRFGLILLMALAGCREKPAPTAAIEEVDQSPTPAAPSPAPPEAAPPAVAKKPISTEDALQGTVHPEMTMRLQMFLQMKGRLPDSVYELQGMGAFDSTPGLPPAYKYQIDPKDKTVKIVRK